MIIEKPVYFIEVEGDIKQYASALPSTIIATYESHINTTYIIVTANEEDHSKEVKKIYTRLHLDFLKKNAKPLKVSHLKNGIDFKLA